MCENSSLLRCGDSAAFPDTVVSSLRRRITLQPPDREKERIPRPNGGILATSEREKGKPRN